MPNSWSIGGKNSFESSAGRVVAGPRLEERRKPGAAESTGNFGHRGDAIEQG
jgi:hypothetical protein